MKKIFLLAALVVIGVCGCSESERLRIVAISGNADEAYCQYLVTSLVSLVKEEESDPQYHELRGLADRWLRLAAEWGNADAQVELGRQIYQVGGQLDLVRNQIERTDDIDTLERALSWICKAAEQGHPDGCVEMMRYRLMLQLKKSHGKDPSDFDPEAINAEARAIRQDCIRCLLIGWQKATKRGNKEKSIACAKFLADRYSELSDQPNQQLWLTRAAEMGDANAQFQLAKMYLKGEGGEKSLEKAIEWLQKAIDQGDPEAQKLMDTLSRNFGGSAMLKAGEYNSK